MDWKEIARWMLMLGASPHAAGKVINSTLPPDSRLLEERVMRIWDDLPPEVREEQQEEFARRVRLVYRKG